MHGLWQALGSIAGSVADMVQGLRTLPPVSLLREDNHDHGGAGEFSGVHAERGHVHGQSDLVQYRHNFLKRHSLGAGTSMLALTLAEALETTRIHSVADLAGVESIGAEHVAGAIQYRCPDRERCRERAVDRYSLIRRHYGG
jgi:hypothetical protein